jgi:hypothetical protein
MEKYPVILSFDVGVIHLSYCLLTKKQLNGKLIWDIIDWNNIDLTNRDMIKCHCGKTASMTNLVNNITNYYCKVHARKVNTSVIPFEEYYTILDTKIDKCSQLVKTNICGKKASFSKEGNCYCTTHAKQLHKSKESSTKMKSFKIQNSNGLNFDDVKYSLINALEQRPNLLSADYVVIENQPSFKNPRMKSIANTIYDYYLIRGIIDKNITKSNITQVKFMAPSNKLKLATDGDTKELVKAKATDDSKGYKMTKSLGIKYCLDLISHLETWKTHFNSHKKKDDLADSFLQGLYFYTNNVTISQVKPEMIEKPIKITKKKKVAKNEIEL